MPELTPELRDAYQKLFDSCMPHDNAYWKAALDHAVQRICKYEMRYSAVGISIGVPWQWIGAIHIMESDGNFACHLHNGDPLTARTVRPPVGRPIQGDPPFYWHTSALDALVMRGLMGKQWDIPTMLYEAERWNGFGYMNRGLNSPYLWSGSQHYTKGKYAKDFVWDPDATSKQVGVGVILKELLPLRPVGEAEVVT